MRYTLNQKKQNGRSPLKEPEKERKKTHQFDGPVSLLLFHMDDSKKTSMTSPIDVFGRKLTRNEALERFAITLQQSARFPSFPTLNLLLNNSNHNL